MDNPHNRSWDQIRPAKRAEAPLNPIRNQVETVIPQTEKEYQLLHETTGFTRPDEKIVFLVGDPTKYPAFRTPQEFIEIACQAVGKHDGYTDFTGDIEVRKQLAELLSTQKWKLNADDVVLTSGGSGALYLSLLSLAKPGDKILMPSPAFPLLNAMAQFYGIEVLRQRGVYFKNIINKDWQPDLNQIDQLLTDNDIKFILVNSPSNPEGSIFTEESITGLIKVCEKHNNLPIVSDEIYEDMVFPGFNFKLLSEYSDNVPILMCSGLTKKCQVPGWRLGWLVMYGKPGVFDQVKIAIRNLTNIILMPNTISQMALIEVYKLGNQRIGKVMSDLQIRYEVLKENLQDLEQVKIGAIGAAMYTTLTIDPSKFEDVCDDMEFARKLQIEQNVLVMPGQVKIFNNKRPFFYNKLFGGLNFLRLVLCCEPDVMKEAGLRIRLFCQKHSKTK